MKKIYKYLVLQFILSSTLLARPCVASLVENLPCAGAQGQNCSLNDFVQIGLNIVQIIFGLAGSLALLYFMYGGIMWVISAGNPEKVKTGLQAITNAVIGLVIIFASYMIIQFVTTSLGYNNSGPFGPWYETPK